MRVYRNQGGYKDGMFTRNGVMNNQYTPAQLDLLKLVNNPDKIDISIFDKIFKFKPGNDANGKLIYENLGKYENLDYDLVLSVIQSMASKI